VARAQCELHGAARRRQRQRQLRRQRRAELGGF
jgi:hypothetical protein